MRLSSAQPENSPSKKCFACWAGSVRVSVRVPHAAQPRSALRCDMALAHPRRPSVSHVFLKSFSFLKVVLNVQQEIHFLLGTTFELVVFLILLGSTRTIAGLKCMGPILLC
jgi:hypothetical protein